MSIKQYIGDRKFYRTVLAVAVPVMIQNGITNFVSLLDNIMVGSLGTESMSGVSIVNQFIFIFNLLIFGAISAAGIFTAQYHGFGDVNGVRDTFRFKFLINILSAVLGIGVFALFGGELISTFLHDGSADGDLALTLSEGLSYLRIMLIGLIPYAISQVYASTMRETGRTVMPMIASIAAVVTNFILNCILIFGLLGTPTLGVTGAAIATVISRFVELLILILWGHLHGKQYAFLTGAFRSFRIPRELVERIVIKGLPLMANELFWSLGITMRNQCYSLRGLDVVAALNISTTLDNLFSVVYLALGTSISIVIGNLLGAGKLEEAKDSDRKLVAFSITCSVGIALLLIATSSLFPLFYDTTDAVRTLSTFMIIVCAATTPARAYVHAAYFTLRSGGKVLVTLLFDSVYMWVLVVPVTAILAYLTPLNIHWLFIICQTIEIVKVGIGSYLLRKGTWLNQLVGDSENKPS